MAIFEEQPDNKRGLYEQVILDHNRNPRNFHELSDATCHAEGYNALCGDQFTIYLKLDTDKRIVEATFTGTGCAISKSSASMMTQAIKGKTQKEAEALFIQFHRMVTSDPVFPSDLGKLEALRGVREYPVRVKCATLAWHTMMAALTGEGKPISTE